MYNILTLLRTGSPVIIGCDAIIWNQKSVVVSSSCQVTTVWVLEVCSISIDNNFTPTVLLCGPTAGRIEFLRLKS